MPWMTAEVCEHGGKNDLASMRPRLIAVDDYGGFLRERQRNVASMRPRLIAVDDAQLGDELLIVRQASMRPRLIAVDDVPRVHSSLRPHSASMRPRLIAVDDDRGEVHAVRRSTASMRPRLIAVDDSPSRNRLFLLKIWRFLRGLCAHTFLGVRVKQNSTRQLGEMLHVFNSLRRCERWPRQCLALERSRPLGGKERGLGGVRR